MTDSKTKFTPGPWAWRYFGNNWSLVTQYQGSRVVLTAGGTSWADLRTRDANGVLKPIDGDHPNARLIAAAPDMFEALEGLLAELKLFLGPLDSDPNDALDAVPPVKRALEALAKARGAQP